MTTILHDRVAGYAGEVRRHLADLGPEVVDELTEGLEADLAEELAERTAARAPRVPGAEGAAAGPAGPDGRGGPGDPDDAVAPELDVSEVFGPAAEYAAELRSAAGLAPAAAPRPRRRSLRPALAEVARVWRVRGLEVVEEIRRVPGGRWTLESLVLLRPVWWIARAWVWYVPLATAYTPGWNQWFPRSAIAVLWFLLMAVVSVAWGRGGLHGRRPVRVALTVLNAAAVVLVVPYLVNATGQVSWHDSTQYVEVPATPEDGVIVGGMYVSNLFVYDADGNPLNDVQIVDDRGRPVRTVTSGTAGEWALPGVTDPWRFAPRADGSGLERWNVYPLLGAPTSAWAWQDEHDGWVSSAELRRPPAPFAKAPQVGHADVPAGGAPSVDTASPAVPDTSSSTAPAPDPNASTEGSSGQPSDASSSTAPAPSPSESAGS